MSAVREGAGGGLIIHGQAGVGKTALLDAAAELATASGLRVLRAAGTEYETDIGYAGLHELLFPLARHIQSLDDAYRDGLLNALGMGSTAAPADRLALVNAVLALLQRVSSKTTLILLVDDLQWVDRASSLLLTIVARRLTSLPVLFIATVRDEASGSMAPTGLAELEIGPLDLANSSALLQRSYSTLRRRAAQEVLAVADGNPLALIELGRTLTQESHVRGALGQPNLPLSNRLASIYGSRLEQLRENTRELLLLAALDGSGSLQVIFDASALETSALEPAENLRLIGIDEANRRLWFRHPLMRSAVVTAASSRARQRAHQKLATALVDQPDRRAWHLAGSTDSRNEPIAQQLEDVAYRCIRRGDVNGAVAAAGRAAELSPDADDRARRLSEAAFFGVVGLGEMQSSTQFLEMARQTGVDISTSLQMSAAAAFLHVSGDGTVGVAHSLLSTALDLVPDPDGPDEPLARATGVLYTVCMLAREPEYWRAFDATIRRLKPALSNEFLLLAGLYPGAQRWRHARRSRPSDQAAGTPDGCRCHLHDRRGGNVCGSLP